MNRNIINIIGRSNEYTKLHPATGKTFGGRQAIKEIEGMPVRSAIFRLSLLVFIIIGSIACKTEVREDPFSREDRIPVQLLQLEATGAAPESIAVSGLFATEEESILSFKNGGVVDRLLVKEGDPVRKGQLLATVHTAEIDAMVQQARLGWEKAQRDHERASRLYRDSVATLEQMQNAATAMKVARQQLNAALVNREYAEIKANTSGYVLKRFVNRGQVVGPGTPVLMINGAANSDWLLNTGVSDRQWTKIRVGDSATVQTDALPGRELPGYVYKKSEGVDPASGTLRVQLKLSGKDHPTIASGMFAKAVIHSSGEATGWLLPADAILDGDAGKAYVFITRDSQRAHKKEVRVGGLQVGGIWVTEGLEGVPAVVISGSPYLNEGSLIAAE